MSPKWTRLHAAVCRFDLASVEFFLDQGDDIECKDVEGKVPLHYAAENGASDLAKEIAIVLLNHRAEVNAVDLSLRTVLHWAARGDAAQMVPILLDRGAALEAKDADETTPLQGASHCNAAVVSRALLDRGANINCTDVDGSTPLHQAAAYDAMETIVVLLAYGAPIEAKDPSGKTPLYWGATFDCLRAITILLKHGALVDVKDDEGGTPLFLASGSDASDVVIELLRHNANLDEIDFRGDTPLHRASEMNSPAAAAVLLAQGANKYARNHDGKLPIHVTASLDVKTEKCHSLPTLTMMLDRYNRRNGSAANEVDMLTILDGSGNSVLALGLASECTVASCLAHSWVFLQALLSRGADAWNDTQAMVKIRKLGLDRHLAAHHDWLPVHWASRSCDVKAVIFWFSADQNLMKAADLKNRTARSLTQEPGGAPCLELIYFFDLCEQLQQNEALNRAQRELHEVQLRNARNAVSLDAALGIFSCQVVALSVGLQTLIIRFHTLTIRFGLAIAPGMILAAGGFLNFVTLSVNGEVPQCSQWAWIWSSLLIVVVLSAKYRKEVRACFTPVKYCGARFSDMFWAQVDLTLNMILFIIVGMAEMFAANKADNWALIAAIVLFAVNADALRTQGRGYGTGHHGIIRGIIGLAILIAMILRRLNEKEDLSDPCTKEEDEDSTLGRCRRAIVSPAVVFMAVGAFVSFLVEFSRILLKLMQMKFFNGTSQEDTDKFICETLVIGRSEEAAGGIVKFLGLSAADLSYGIEQGVEGMRQEVIKHGDANDLENFGYIVDGLSGNIDDFPKAVLESLEVGKYHGGAIVRGEFDYGHEGRTLQDWMQLTEVTDAALSEAEFVAVRFYTSSSYRMINYPLRTAIVPHPWAMVVYFLDSGIKKLRSVQAKRNPEEFAQKAVLWRGLKNLMLNIEEFKKVGGTELAPMSTTSSEDVARKYAASEVPLLLKYKVSGLRKGVSIKFLSLYPKEEEFLYPPLTYISFKKKYEDDGVNIVVIEPVMS